MSNSLTITVVEKYEQVNDFETATRLLLQEKLYYEKNTTKEEMQQITKNILNDDNTFNFMQSFFDDFEKGLLFKKIKK